MGAAGLLQSDAQALQLVGKVPACTRLWPLGVPDMVTQREAFHRFGQLADHLAPALQAQAGMNEASGQGNHQQANDRIGHQQACGCRCMSRH